MLPMRSSRPLHRPMASSPGIRPQPIPNRPASQTSKPIRPVEGNANSLSSRDSQRIQQIEKKQRDLIKQLEELKIEKQEIEAMKHQFDYSTQTYG